MRLFKPDISIDKHYIATYGTVILQTTQSKRLTSANFFKKKAKKIGYVLILLMKKSGCDRNSNNIVKGVSAGRNSETTNCKKNRKVNACDCTKSKPYHVKRVGSIGLATEKIYMVMCAKQRR